MSTQKLFGTSMLIDNVTGMMQSGEIAIMFNSDGQSEIQVRNPETGDVESVQPESPDSGLIEQLVQAIRSIHRSYDIGVTITEAHSDE